MSEAYIGEIRIFAGDFAPVGWLVCNGALIPISENEALYSLIGTTYGGDGITTFAIPDFQGRAVLHQGQNSATGSKYILGKKGGTETVVLTASDLPPHTHTPHSNSGMGNANEPTGMVWANDNDTKQYSNKTDGTLMSNNVIGITGQNVPHNNMMPYLSLNYIICVEGYYPTQD